MKNMNTFLMMQSISAMTLEERVLRLEKIIESMIPKNEQWVQARVITKKTGWNSEDLRRARRNGSIKYKVKKEGSKRTYAYLLSSVIS